MSQDELLAEIERLRHRVCELEDIRARHERTERALRESEVPLCVPSEHIRQSIFLSELGITCKKEEGAQSATSRLNQILIDSMPCVALLLRPHSREIVASNAEAVKVGAVPGARCFSTWGKREDPCPWCLAPKLWESGEAQHLEVEALGTVFDAHWVPVSSDLYMHYAFDVTERRRAEEMLKASKERLALALAGANLGIWEWDLTTGRAVWDERMHLVLGYEPNELVPDIKNWKRLVHPDDWPRVSENLNLHIEKKLPIFEAEYRMLNKLGNWQWVKVRGNFIAVDSEGKPTKMAGVFGDITNRKNTEEALRSSEKAYRTLAQNIPGIVYRVHFGDQPTMEFFNNAVESVTGFSEGDLRTGEVCSIDGLILSEDRPTVVKLVLRAVQENKPFEIEYRIRDKNGTIRHLLEYGRPIRSAVGSKTSIDGVIFDVTERKRAEEAMRQGEVRYRYLVENIEDLICTHDLEGNLLFVSSVPAQLLGSSSTDMVGTNLRSYLASEVRDQFDEYLATIRREGRASGFMTVRSRSGERRVWEYRNKFITEPGGTPIVLGVARDVTERRRAERVERRLATAIDQADEGVLITNMEGTIQYVNPGLLRMTGYHRDELLGRTPRILISGERDPTFYRQVWDIVKAGNIWSGSIENRRKDGRLYYADATITPVRDTSDKIVNFVAVVRDITEHQEMAKQLLQAQKMEAIGTLAGGIAHDFNNLLQVTLGYSELLLEEKSEEDPDHADLQKIHQAARSGAELVENLLTFSRKTEPKPLSMMLNSAIGRAENLLRRTIPRMIDIRLNPAQNLERINADPAQIEQIIMNLAVNAKDAMGDRGILTIQTENVTLDEEYCRSNAEAKVGDYVLLSVSDTGHGMDGETLQHIFEPFYTTKELGRGTGLGLAMVYGIVKQHGGHIQCSSEVGKGTTFTIYFPAVSSVEDPAVQQEDMEPAFGTETVLVVDDEEFVRELAERILTKNGYTVLTATNGEEALDLYDRERDRIHLIVLDLIMPAMGGKDCLRGLLKVNPDLKVLIASGYSPDSSTKECLDLGAKGFVAKPFEFRELLRRVRTTLDEV